ncbi:MAG: hypothetical protein ACRCYP_06625 [Alphaproteobacteria bacterium]
MQTKTEISQPAQNPEAVAQTVVSSIWIVLFVVITGAAIAVFNQKFFDRLYWKFLWFMKGKIDEQIALDIDCEKHQLENIYRMKSVKK